MIRQSILAGTWYPEKQNELKNLIRDMLAEGEDPGIETEIRGMISPHAGYAFSGLTAAAGYRQLQGRSYDHVIIISPQHRYGDARYLTSAADGYETPLGVVPVNRAIIADLMQMLPLNAVQRDTEHAVEIQLPFLQTVLQSFDIVPLMVGPAGVYDCDDLIAALQAVCAGERTLLVASSDLHHLNDYRQVEKQDGKLIAALEKYDMIAVKQMLDRPDCTVCGKVPVTAVMAVLQQSGAEHLRVVQRTNSADVTGQRVRGQYTVGYLSALMY